MPGGAVGFGEHASDDANAAADPRSGDHSEHDVIVGSRTIARLGLHEAIGIAVYSNRTPERVAQVLAQAATHQQQRVRRTPDDAGARLIVREMGVPTLP